MKKRNMILIALALTSVMVFVQIGAIAANTPDAPSACVIVGNQPCQNCDAIYWTGVVCHADINNWQQCCDECQNSGFTEVIDNTQYYERPGGQAPCCGFA